MPNSYDRREFLGKSVRAGTAFTVLGASGLLLDACGGGSKTVDTTLSTSNAAQVGVNVPGKSQKLGGTVIFGTEAEESGMDPTYGHFDSTGVLYARCVFDPLAMVTAKGEVVPYLAQSITPNSTFTSWRISVRPNVVFSDNTPCDAKALKFCMDAFQNSYLVNFALNYWKPIGAKGVTATSIVDSQTIQIDMVAPWVAFPAWLAGYIGGQIAYMFSPKAYTTMGESKFSLNPVGTGPFMLQVWDVGSQFVCVRNPYYWQKDALGRQLPYLDAWTYRPQPLVATRKDALESGAIQMMHTDDDPTIVQLEAEKNIDLILDDEIQIGEPDCNFGMINCSDPLMSDLTLRQAASYAFDQDRYCQVLGNGIIHPTFGPFPKPSPYAGTTGYPSFDLAKAKSLIAAWQAKPGNAGKTPTATYTTTVAANPASAELVQYMMQQAGFKINVATVQQAALIDDALGGKYQIFSWRQFANIDPDLNYVFWTKAAGAVNFARNYDKIIDDAMDTARQTGDDATRLTSYQTVAKRFAVDLPYLWASRDVWCVAASDKVQNWNNPMTPDAPYARGLSMLSGIIMPTQVWIDQT